MLRHVGQKRNYIHNTRLAVLLCLTAGFVNAAGFMGFSVLTTNVTGHAALLAVKLAEDDLHWASTAGLWLCLFLAGTFVSSWYIGYTGRNRAWSYTVPIIFEMLILIFVGTFAVNYDQSLKQTEYFAGSLLFAMGMQNALVTIISGSVVRTTHLTGVFTDLGIDLSTLVLSPAESNPILKKKISLRLSIIISFLMGGIGGGYVFIHFHFHAFYFPAAILLLATGYDYFRIAFKRMVYSIR